MIMDMVRNLSTQEKRDQFRKQFYRLVEKEALRMCRNKDDATLLAEYVFLRTEHDYAARVLPSYCEPFLVGQTCLAYAGTGGKAEEIRSKIEALQAKQSTPSGEADA